MALPNIDLTKLSKLRQRLVAPSIFSTQYLFPGSQMFFRDFIVASENHQIFIEQLKAVLIHELIQMDSSTYDVFNISDAENSNRSEYVVRMKNRFFGSGKPALTPHSLFTCGEIKPFESYGTQGYKYSTELQRIGGRFVGKY